MATVAELPPTTASLPGDPPGPWPPLGLLALAAGLLAGGRAAG